MKDLKAHIALFAVAVVATVLTWNRPRAPVTTMEIFPVWDHDSTDFKGFHYVDPDLDLRIVRRAGPDGPFYWGIEKREDLGTDSLVFPVGGSGPLLMPRLVDLPAMRDLGRLSPGRRTRFGLEDSDVHLTVEFTDERRELVVGDSVYGGSDRYVMEPATGRGYVISRDIMNVMELGEGALRQRTLHNFPVREIAEVRVAAGAERERRMARTESDEWTEPGSDTPDPGFANFMERVDQLTIEGYDSLPPVERLKLVVRIDYLDDDGDALGFSELLRDDLADRSVYYLRSESTRIIARAHSVLTERVEQAVEDIF
ncbi:MAG: DUF4340 domain-containing protein [Gemmatimonadota bacterium]|nr:DUF4340 domain-containing protein [Gemmatimonadota bacterium]MDE2871097.1 DUF4340 domain-containing protein [Gemmatimonadota bacterium]